MFIARFSVRSLMFAVFLVAANCALLAPIGGYCPLGYLFGMLGVLPLANILAITAYRTLSRRTAAQPFFVGFVVTGVILIVAWFNVCTTADDSRLRAFNQWMNQMIVEMPVLQNIAYAIDMVIPRGSVSLLAYLSLFALLTAAPQLLLSLLAGRLARRFAGSDRSGQNAFSAPTRDDAVPAR
jgi:hypothetical protein